MYTNATFYNEELGKLRVFEPKKGEILFCGNDIAKILNNKTPENAINRYCQHGVVLKNLVVKEKDQNGMTMRADFSENYVYEQDALTWISLTKKDVALTLERWLYREILPLIKVHGLNNGFILWEMDWNSNRYMGESVD